jgi:hypothetical protein
MRHAARIDANKLEIVKTLRAAGFYVYDLKLPVDLLVGRGRQTWLIECKDGKKPPSGRKLTALQADFLKNWTGGGLVVVTSPQEALELLERS